MDVKNFFVPMWFWNTKALWNKFVILGLLCLGTIVLPALFYWNEVRQSIQFSRYEQMGLPQVKLTLHILQLTQQHRGITARVLQDPIMPRKEQRKKAEELEQAIFDYEIYFDQHPNARLHVNFVDWVNQWHGLHQKIAANSLLPKDSFDQHTGLIRQQLNHLQNVIDYYQLSLDPQADGYFLISASLMELPELTESLAQVRGIGVGLLAQGHATQAERTQLNSLLLLSQNRMQQLDLSIPKVVSANAGQLSQIVGQYRHLQQQYQKMLSLVQNEILMKEDLSYNPEQFFNEMTLGIDSYFHFADFSAEQIHNILQERITKTQQHMYSLLLYVLCVTIVVAIICIRFVRKLLRRLGGEPEYASQVVLAVARGDLDYEIETPHTDSLLANIKLMQEKLKENDRLKNEFIATISHELRTPLTSIGGALSVAISGKLGELPAQISTMLDIAHQNTLRLTELINDLLDIDKLSIGKLVLDLHPQPIMPIIDAAVSAMNSYAHKCGVHLIMGPRFEYVLAKVDARRLQQVLSNLLSNAIKFSHKGDDVYINVKVLTESLRIEVVDLGIGIPIGIQGRIFQKFSQADSSSTRTAGGAGLGLAIARELIEGMSGRIGFISAEGSGSCFYIELPMEEPNTEVGNAQENRQS